MNLKLADNWHKWRYTSYTSGISLTQCDNSESDIFVTYIFYTWAPLFSTKIDFEQQN